MIVAPLVIVFSPQFYDWEVRCRSLLALQAKLVDLTMFAEKSEDFVSVLFFEVKLEKYYNNITVITIKVCLT